MNPGGTRNEAGTGGGVDARAIVDRVDDLEQVVQRMQVRQRAVMRVVAQHHGSIFREIEALLRAG